MYLPVEVLPFLVHLILLVTALSMEFSLLSFALIRESIRALHAAMAVRFIVIGLPVVDTSLLGLKRFHRFQFLLSHFSGLRFIDLPNF